MTILLDHCVPRKFLHWLVQWGYAATTVKEHVSPSTDDQGILELAKSLNAVLLTVDMDFSNIKTYPPHGYCGIVVLRYQVQDEELAAKTLKRMLEELYPNQLDGSLVVISGDRYRQRKE